jgi:hypothetical protein
MHLLEALTIAPNDAALHATLGYVESIRGDLSKAQLLYEQSLQANADNMIVTGLVNTCTHDIASSGLSFSHHDQSDLANADKDPFE